MWARYRGPVQTVFPLGQPDEAVRPRVSNRTVVDLVDDHTWTAAMSSGEIGVVAVSDERIEVRHFSYSDEAGLGSRARLGTRKVDLSLSYESRPRVETFWTLEY